MPTTWWFKMSSITLKSVFSISRPQKSLIYVSRHVILSPIKLQTQETTQSENAPSLLVPQWTPQSRRTGLLALKLGMSQLWDHKGRRQAVTLLQVIDNEVVMTRTKDKEGYNGLQIGAVNHDKPKNISGPVMGQFKKAEVSPKRHLQEFRVTEDALIEVGTKLSAAHFVAGQYVDVCGITIGKGFQGVMKRHGMKGQPASHGVTKTHRKMGATGGGQDPGRIWPGKKMPGRMGCNRVTMKNLKVYRINNRFNVLYVRGNVPGHKNAIVRITDALRRPHETPPPFPTFPYEKVSSLPEETYWEYLHPPHAPTITVSVQVKDTKKE